jgi:hypothetical protein
MRNNERWPAQEGASGFIQFRKVRTSIRPDLSEIRRVRQVSVGTACKGAPKNYAIVPSSDTRAPQIISLWPVMSASARCGHTRL